VVDRAVVDHDDRLAGLELVEVGNVVGLSEAHEELRDALRFRERTCGDHHLSVDGLDTHRKARPCVRYHSLGQVGEVGVLNSSSGRFECCAQYRGAGLGLHVILGREHDDPVVLVEDRLEFPCQGRHEINILGHDDEDSTDVFPVRHPIPPSRNRCERCWFPVFYSIFTDFVQGRGFHKQKTVIVNLGGVVGGFPLPTTLPPRRRTLDKIAFF